jgi:hypothetical protein
MVVQVVAILFSDSSHSGKQSMHTLYVWKWSYSKFWKEIVMFAVRHVLIHIWGGELEVYVNNYPFQLLKDYIHICEHM